MNEIFCRTAPNPLSNHALPWCFCVLSLHFALSPFALCQAGVISVPNSSFQSPAVPNASPYAAPDIDDWQKSPQPDWYDPSQNSNTPWTYLMGEFYNVPFPGQFIDNCDGAQAAFLFALPGAALFQDYSSIDGTNAGPSHSFNAKFNVGSFYDLTVAVLGGGGGMKPGVSLELQLYYRDSSSNIVVVSSTTVTNDIALFPTNTHFVDFTAHLPQVRPSDLWAGQNIGIRLSSSVSFELSGGYWDLDNVRLLETTAPVLQSGVTGGDLTITLESETGMQFEIQRTTNIASNADWVRVAAFTNITGVIQFKDSVTNSAAFYRARRF
jgi:hypothetical protein